MTHKQKVLRLLSDHKPHSHHELYDLHVIGHSRISDLRRDGHKIDQWREDGHYWYRLVALGEAPETPAGASPSASSIPASPLKGNPADRGGDALQLFTAPRGAYGD